MMTADGRNGKLMSKPRWIALALIGLGAVSVVAWQSTRRQHAPERVQRVLDRAERVALLEELQPVALKNRNLKRFGSANDGGYLLCDNLSEGIQSAYSYGVGANDELGCDVSKRYSVPVHQYDCFDPGRPTCQGGVFVFHNECIGPRPERDKEQRVFDTLQNQISKNKDIGKRLIVKIDVEGAEWNSLMVTPDAVLDQIDQMPMELHIDPNRRGVDRGDSKTQAEILCGQFALQQFCLHTECRTTAGLGVPGLVGQQAARSARRIGSNASSRERAQRSGPSGGAGLPALFRPPLGTSTLMAATSGAVAAKGEARGMATAHTTVPASLR